VRGDREAPPTWHRPSRRGKGIALLGAATAFVASVLLVAGASPASAHAVLESTTPTQGTQVDSLPAEVTLTFGEDVTIDQNSLRIIGTDGRRVDTGQVHHPDGERDKVGIALLSDARRGSYTVIWRVVSADSHPVAGTFSFGFGVPAGETSVAAPAGSRLVGILDGAARFVAYAGLACGLGAALFASILWRASWDLRPTRVLFGAGLGLLAISAAGLLLLAAPYNAGRSLGYALSLSGFRETLRTRLGQLLVLRLGLVLLAALIWIMAKRPADRRSNNGFAVRLDAAAVGVVAVLTFSLAEHAGAGRQHVLATGVDAVHLAAASAWIGGLGVLLLAVLRPGTDIKTTATEALPRWSCYALGCVGLVAVTGIYQSWREVGTWPAFGHTVYGRLLLVKIGLLVFIVCLGFFGRQRVRSLRKSTDVRVTSVRGLRRAVGAEVALSAVALGVVAVLVNVQPGRDSYNPTFTTSAVAQGISAIDQLHAVVRITSTRAGPTDISVAVSDAQGQPVDFAEVSGLITEPEKDLGPVRFGIPAAQDGRGVVRSVVVPESGHWQLVLQIRVGSTSSYAMSTSYVVR
jgi:copper transport protein